MNREQPLIPARSLMLRRTIYVLSHRAYIKPILILITVNKQSRYEISFYQSLISSY